MSVQRRSSGPLPPHVVASVMAPVAAALGTTLGAVVLRRRPPGGAGRWARTNHRGEPVTLLEGPGVAAGALLALALPVAPSRLRAAAAVAVAGGCVLGAYDDLAGDGGSKGLAGHLRPLRHGEVTTGAVKVAGLSATGLAAALLAGAGRPGTPGADRSGRVTTLTGLTAPALRDALVGGGVVAGCANLVNLLDLRPGRALKATLLGAALVPGGGRPLAAVAAGAAIAALPGDLAERSMLGDTGANAVGALLGMAVLAASSAAHGDQPATARRAARAGVLAVLTALTLASEHVSFSAVIESTPVLRTIDRLGRRAGATR